MHPIGLIVLLTTLYFVVWGSRRAALIGMVAGILYLTEAQAFNVGINFFALRILGIALFIRVVTRHEFSFSRLNKIDRAVVMLYGYVTIVYLLRSQGQDLSVIAGAFDALFCYFGFRGLIKA